MRSINYTVCIIIFISCLVLFTPFSIFAQQEYCDEEILSATTTQHPLVYQPRGDRCEGSYGGGRPSHDTIITLVSLTEYVEPYELSSNQEVVFQWAAPRTPSVRLRAEGLRDAYRLDTVRPAGETAYQLPLDVMSALGISYEQLGALAWARYNLGGAQDVYIPLTITQQGSPQSSNTYRIILWPEAELNEVYVSLATVNSGGDPQDFIRYGEPLQYGYYQAKRAIVFEIDKPDKTGAYYLEIGVTIKSGGSDNVAYYFYHAG